VAVVERGELWLPQALGYSEDSYVDEADAQVGVGHEQRTHTRVVDRLERLHDERFAAAILEKPDKCVGLMCASEVILELHKHGRGHDPILTTLFEQRRARLVLLVARLDRGEQRPRVDD
jgi:hypothetical protein